MNVSNDQFAELYGEYHGRIYSFALARVKCPHVAEDLTHNTFLRALEALPQYEERGAPFGAWLFSVARTAMVNEFRSRKKHSHLSIEEAEAVLEIADESHDFDQLMASNERIKNAIEGLTDEQKPVVLLRIIGDLSAEDTAKALGKPIGAVKSLKRRAVKRMERGLGAA